MLRTFVSEGEVHGGWWVSRRVDCKRNGSSGTVAEIFATGFARVLFDRRSSFEKIVSIVNHCLDVT